LRDPAADASLKAQCEPMLRALRPRIARLLVRVRAERGAAVEADIDVEVDGHPWPRAAWDIASPVDPGSHTVLLKRGAAELLRNQTELGEGTAREVVLEVPAPAPLPSVSLPASPTPIDEASQARPLYKNWIVWTAAGAVVVAGVVTGVLLATRNDPKDEAPVLGNATPGVLTW